MRRLKAPAAVVALALLVACSTVAPGQDPILVRAQQGYSNAEDTLNMFFQIEDQNQVVLEGKIPGLHKIVEQMRRQAKGCATCQPVVPSALDEYYNAIETYEKTKDKTGLDKWGPIVQQLLDSAKKYIAQGMGK